VPFLNKDNVDEMKWRDHFKTFVNRWKLSFLPWQSVNDRKKHVKWAYIQVETHGPTVEMSEIYAFR